MTPIKNTGVDGDTQCNFYFTCDCCGEPIEDLDGVVDFPAFSWSEKIKQPYRFYHRGPCAKQGDKLRLRDKWGNFSLRAFLLNLLIGEDIGEFVFKNDSEEIRDKVFKALEVRG
jgi:aspartyl-tRNA synthetase